MCFCCHCHYIALLIDTNMVDEQKKSCDFNRWICRLQWNIDKDSKRLFCLNHVDKYFYPLLLQEEQTVEQSPNVFRTFDSMLLIKCNTNEYRHSNWLIFWFCYVNSKSMGHKSQCLLIHRTEADVSHTKRTNLIIQRDRKHCRVVSFVSSLQALWHESVKFTRNQDFHD